MEKQVADYIMENHQIHTKYRKVVVDGVGYSHGEFNTKVLFPIVDGLGLPKFYKEYPSDSDKKKFTEKVLSLALKLGKDKVKAKYKTQGLPDGEFKGNYTPIVDVVRNTKVLYNEDLKGISSVSFDCWVEGKSKEERGIIRQNTRMAVFKYDPYDISSFTLVPFESSEILRVNLFNPPPWRHTPQTIAECPKEVETLLQHLFPTKEAQTYILDWLYHCMVERNEAYLVLNGAKGIGKGIFCTLVKALVGQANYAEAPDSFLESQFNSVLDNKRVIVLDEFTVDKKKHSKLKRYINKHQNIEKKGIDADKAVETYNSFIISNNDESDMYLEYDDRRFSAVDLTDKNLIESMSEKEINSLVAELENEESDIVSRFGYYIFNRGVNDYTVFSVFKGSKYKSLVENSLKVWQKFLINQILDSAEETLSIRELRDASKMENINSQFPSNITKIADFFKNYKYNNRVIGTVEHVNGVACVRGNPDLGKEDELCIKDPNIKDPDSEADLL